MIEVRYFARVRSLMGRGEDRLTFDASRLQTAADVRRTVFADVDQEALGPDLKVAVNQQMAQWDSPVADGDEVAFFPPVTGG